MNYNKCFLKLGTSNIFEELGATTYKGQSLIELLPLVNKKLEVEEQIIIIGINDLYPDCVDLHITLNRDDETNHNRAFTTFRKEELVSYLYRYLNNKTFIKVLKQQVRLLNELKELGDDQAVYRILEVPYQHRVKELRFMRENIDDPEYNKFWPVVSKPLVETHSDKEYQAEVNGHTFVIRFVDIDEDIEQELEVNKEETIKARMECETTGICYEAIYSLEQVKEFITLVKEQPKEAVKLLLLEAPFTSSLEAIRLGLETPFHKRIEVLDDGFGVFDLKSEFFHQLGFDNLELEKDLIEHVNHDVSEEGVSFIADYYTNLDRNIGVVNSELGVNYRIKVRLWDFMEKPFLETMVIDNETGKVINSSYHESTGAKSLIHEETLFSDLIEDIKHRDHLTDVSVILPHTNLHLHFKLSLFKRWYKTVEEMSDFIKLNEILKQRNYTLTVITISGRKDLGLHDGFQIIVSKDNENIINLGNGEDLQLVFAMLLLDVERTVTKLETVSALMRNLAELNTALTPDFFIEIPFMERENKLRELLQEEKFKMEENTYINFEFNYSPALDQDFKELTNTKLKELDEVIGELGLTARVENNLVDNSVDVRIFEEEDYRPESFRRIYVNSSVGLFVDELIDHLKTEFSKLETFSDLINEVIPTLENIVFLGELNKLDDLFSKAEIVNNGTIFKNLMKQVDDSFTGIEEAQPVINLIEEEKCLLFDVYYQSEEPVISTKLTFTGVLDQQVEELIKEIESFKDNLLQEEEEVKTAEVSQELYDAIQKATHDINNMEEGDVFDGLNVSFCDRKGLLEGLTKLIGAEEVGNIAAVLMQGKQLEGMRLHYVPETEVVEISYICKVEEIPTDYDEEITVQIDARRLHSFLIMLLGNEEYYEGVTKVVLRRIRYHRELPAKGYSTEKYEAIEGLNDLTAQGLRSDAYIPVNSYIKHLSRIQDKLEEVEYLLKNIKDISFKEALLESTARRYIIKTEYYEETIEIKNIAYESGLDNIILTLKDIEKDNSIVPVLRPSHNPVEIPVIDGSKRNEPIETAVPPRPPRATNKDDLKPIERKEDEVLKRIKEFRQLEEKKATAPESSRESFSELEDAYYNRETKRAPESSMGANNGRLVLTGTKVRNNLLTRLKNHVTERINQWNYLNDNSDIEFISDSLTINLGDLSKQITDSLEEELKLQGYYAETLAEYIGNNRRVKLIIKVANY